VAEAPGEAPRAVGAPHTHEHIGEGHDGHAHDGAGAGGAAAPTANAQAPTAPSTTGDGGLRRLRRFDDQRHRAKMERLDEEVAMAEAHDGVESSPTPAPKPAPTPTAKTDPAARKVAERWFSAMASGDIGAAAALAALPFKTSGKDVTKRGTLTAMLTDLAGEEKSSGAPSIQIYTTAGLRSAIGKLPANVDDGSGAQLYALASRGARDALILILAQRGGEWHPVGLVRR
jgi:hypothetical protein